MTVDTQSYTPASEISEMRHVLDVLFCHIVDNGDAESVYAFESFVSKHFDASYLTDRGVYGTCIEEQLLKEELQRMLTYLQQERQAFLDSLDESDCSD